MTLRRSTPLKPEEIEPHMCTIHARLDILSRVPFFAGLPPEAVAEINQLFHEHGYEPGQPIYYAGDRATRLFVVAVGKVKLLQHAFSGQDVLLDILTPGEFFGNLPVLGADAYPDTALAQTMCCILTVAAADFQTILQRYPAVTLSVLSIVSQRLHAAQERVRQLSAHPVEYRLAAALLKLAEKLGQPQPEGLLIQMPLSRQDLAEMTGTTIETASRVMSQFQKEGLIRTGRQWVAVADLKGLAALVEEA